MNYRAFGDTGLTVSEIGFGCWGLGGDAYGKITTTEAGVLLHRAYDAGITLYDTSDFYGQGRSESLIGEHLRHVRSKIVIASKVGLVPASDGDFRQDFSADHIVQALDDSLRRLQTNYIDIYQLHSPSLDVLEQPAVLEALQKCREAGKVRFFGVSVKSPDDGVSFLRRFQCQSIQANLNLIDQRAVQNGLLDAVSAEHAGFIARPPFVFGFLTGKYAETTAFGTHDHRSNWPRDTLKQWSESVALFQELIDNQPHTPAQFALRYCLSHPAVSCVIPGMMQVSEMEENLQASALGPLSEPEIARIQELYAHSPYNQS